MASRSDQQQIAALVKAVLTGRIEVTLAFGRRDVGGMFLPYGQLNVEGKLDRVDGGKYYEVTANGRVPIDRKPSYPARWVTHFGMYVCEQWVTQICGSPALVRANESLTVYMTVKVEGPQHD